MRLSDSREWQAGRNIVDQLIAFQQRCQISYCTLSDRGIQVVDNEEVQMDALPNCRGKGHTDFRIPAAVDDHLTILSQNGNIRVEIGGEVYLHNTVYTQTICGLINRNRKIIGPVIQDNVCSRFTGQRGFFAAH